MVLFEQNDPPRRRSPRRLWGRGIGIELGGSQLGTMAVVLAYEVARYLAQKGDGAFVDDDNEWFAVHDGAFVDP